MSCFEALQPKGKACERQDCPIFQVFEDEQEIVEHVELKMDGQQSCWFRSVIKVALKDGQGRPLAVLKSFRDVTEEYRGRQRLLEQRRKLRSMAVELTIAEERERKRLAGVLHDEICQRLVSAKMLLDLMQQQETSISLQETLDKTCEILKSTVRYAHDLTFSVSAPQVYELGLVSALKGWLTEEIQDLHFLDIQTIAEDVPLNLDEDLSMFVFRSVRELVFNVIKHAEAKHVTICLTKRGSFLWVSVRDDGVGFDMQEDVEVAPKSKRGYGLFSIKERLAYLGGQLTIKSLRGKGTWVVLMVPIQISDHCERLV